MVSWREGGGVLLAGLLPRQRWRRLTHLLEGNVCSERSGHGELWGPVAWSPSSETWCEVAVGPLVTPRDLRGAVPWSGSFYPCIGPPVSPGPWVSVQRGVRAADAGRDGSAPQNPHPCSKPRVSTTLCWREQDLWPHMVFPEL